MKKKQVNLYKSLLLLIGILFLGITLSCSNNIQNVRDFLKDTHATDEGSKIHTHTYSEAWTSDASGHWHAATCEHTEEKSGFAEHTYGDWEKAATNNNVVKKCIVCEHIQIIPGFVFVKGGSVTGAAYTNNYEGVFIEGRTVTLSDFYMGKYEVTQEEYASVMAGQKVTVNGTEYPLEINPSLCTKDSTKYTLFSGDEQKKRPVEGVT